MWLLVTPFFYVIFLSSLFELFSVVDFTFFDVPCLKKGLYWTLSKFAEAGGCLVNGVDSTKRVVSGDRCPFVLGGMFWGFLLLLAPDFFRV
jgi:hypothetical protein